jgi:aspartate/methionine/tyrosine aminotransferase
VKLPPFALERYFARHEFSARYLLCCSDCETMSIGELTALEPGGAEALAACRLGYTESRGSPALRQEIARGYDGLGPEHVLVHAGAQEAIFLFMHAALAAGDQVVVHTPCYQSLAEVARSIGCEVAPWRAREDHGWELDPDELAGLLGPRTKAIVLNTPHNPTGSHMAAGAFREVLRLADSRGIALFSDEVYRGLEYEAGDRLPPACTVSERAVSLGVMSKTLGLAGLRIGWAATRDTGMLERMAALKDYTTICSSAPSEVLAGIALRHGETLAARNRLIVTGNLRLLDSFFQRHEDRLSWHRPKAGPIAFPRLKRGEVEAFCDGLLRARGVLLLPGSVYGDRENHFRIGFGRRDMPEALRLFESYLG